MTSHPETATESTDQDAVERVHERCNEMAAALGRTWTDDEPWRFLTDLTTLGSRMAGSDGEHRAAEIVADAFEQAGLTGVETDPFEIDVWERGSAQLRISAPTQDGGATAREFESIALPYSPAGTVSGRLVDVGYGTPAEIDERDVDGRIAVASTTTPPGGRFVHRMEKFGYAIESGAVGFVFVNHLDGQLPPTGSLTFGGEADAVAVGVSKRNRCLASGVRVRCRRRRRIRRYRGGDHRRGDNGTRGESKRYRPCGAGYAGTTPLDRPLRCTRYR